MDEDVLSRTPGFYEQGRYTTGDWETEEASCVALDSILGRLDCFHIYREVRGYYLQPRLGQRPSTPRIDRVLVPKPTLRQRGWPYGPIGVECKRSNENIGPPLSQLLDYSRAIWEVEPSIWVAPEWLFLWPMDGLGGPLLSVFAQNRLGMAGTGRNALVFHNGQNMATFGWDGSLRIGAGLNGCGRSGRKAGSR